MSETKIRVGTNYLEPLFYFCDNCKGESMLLVDQTTGKVTGQICQQCGYPNGPDFSVPVAASVGSHQSLGITRITVRTLLR